MGAGAVIEATGATLLVVFVLGLLRPLEKYVTSYGGVARVTVEVEPRPEAVAEIERIIRGTGLEVEEIRSEQRGDRLVVQVAMSGPTRLHDRAKLELLRASGAFTISVEE